VLTRRALLAGLGALGTGAAGVVRAEATQVLTATDVHVPGYPTVEAIKWMGETLLRETGGRLGIRLYHSGQLGRESDAIDLVRFGALDMTRVFGAALNNPFPLTRILSLPFVFESTPHLRRAVDGPVGRGILEGFAARGLVGLALYDSGARSIYNTRRPVHAPADLHGLKLRVPPSDIFMDVVRGLGANPTPLPYGEVYSALQTHLIDGAENNWPSFHTTRQFEVARYWSETTHAYTPEALLLSRRSYDALAPGDRALLVEVAAQSVPMMRGLWDAYEAKSREHVLAHGAIANPVDRAAFQRSVAPLVDAYRKDQALDRQYRAIRELA
jgi:tripartite ATP-independent transporter DctP family solute receptor